MSLFEDVLRNHSRNSFPVPAVIRPTSSCVHADCDSNDKQGCAYGLRCGDNNCDKFHKDLSRARISPNADCCEIDPNVKTTKPTKPTDKILTCGGSAYGAACVFPFTYKGKKYTKCTADDHTQEWCSTTATYSNKWGNCNCDGAVCLLTHKCKTSCA